MSEKLSNTKDVTHRLLDEKCLGKVAKRLMYADYNDQEQNGRKLGQIMNTRGQNFRILGDGKTSGV